MATQASSTTASKVFTGRNILLRQLEKRGFNVSNYTNFSVNEVHNMLQNKQCDIIVEDDKGRKVYVKYHLSKAIHPNHILEVVDELFYIEQELNKHTDQVIIITKTDANDTITNCLTQLYHSDKVFVTIYSIKRLQFDILQHDLVPEHIILLEEERQALFEKYNITKPSELPEISRFDPVAVAIGIRPGEVCKILRKSKTAVSSEYFRMCY